MKRPMAVGVMVGILLTISAAAFATPVRWENTVTTPALPKTSSDGSPISWLQAYNPTDALHPGSSNNDPILTDAGHTPTLTILANDVDTAADTFTVGHDVAGHWVFGETDVVSWPQSGSFRTLTQGANGADTTTVFNLTNPNSWLKGTTGFNVTVNMDGTFSVFYPTTIKRATLVVWTDWTAPPTPPVVPVPGAMLLASLGAGLVSLLRTRKVL